MPPKKGKRKESLRPEDADRERQSEAFRPAFDNVPFLRLLLSTARESVDLWPQHIAAALQLSDFYVDLRHSVLVDLYFNYLSFAVQHHFSAEKTRAFIEDQERLRAMIMKNPDVSVAELSAAFKEQMLNRTRPPPPPPPVVEPPVLEDEPEKKPRERVRIKTKEELREERELKEKQEREKREAVEPVVYSVADVANVIEFTTSGILQHHSLYRYLFLKQSSREVETAATVKAVVENAAIPAPLQRAYMEHQYIEAMALQRMQEEEEDRRRLREYDEKATAERQAALRAQQEEEQRLQEERERAAFAIQLATPEAQALVTAAAAEIEEALNVRRRRILERIVAIEERIGGLP